MSIGDEEVKNVVENSLLRGEKWWRSRFQFLESRGYRLRPRYHPDWRPSWIDSGKSRLDCEDNYRNIVATGRRVYLKAVEKSSAEKSIALLFCTAELSPEPQNHCVPILDHFDDPEDPSKELIVMPLLRRFNTPPFDRVDEVLDFVKQTLEATTFIHERTVAHRDLCMLNIMYDAEKLYPEGYHPSLPDFSPDVMRPARFISRAAAGGVKYYVTDFGISTRFEDGEERLVIGTMCQDKTVPELSETDPYDPFAVDIYTLGNVYKENILEAYKNLKFLKPLIESMTRTDPKTRPTAKQAFERFNDIVSRQPLHVIYWKAKRAKSHRITHMYQNVISLGTAGVAYAQWLASKINILKQED